MLKMAFDLRQEVVLFYAVASKELLVGYYMRRAEIMAISRLL